MDDLEVALSKHAPWYDSFDQNADSWGCECNHQTGYRTREEVVAKHIAPLIRTVVHATTTRLDDIQRKLDENGNLLRGQATRHVWDDVNRLVDYCNGNNLRNLAMAFKDYEDERRRQAQAIMNLENQMTTLSNTYRETMAKHAVLDKILRDSDIDPDVLLKTHKVFQ